MTTPLAPAWDGVEGGCNCGRIRYRLSEGPISGYLCHCHLCQKRSGSAFSFQLVLPAGALTLTDGEPIRRDRIGSGGLRSTSLWCGECFSRLAITSPDFPWITLRAGTLDETAHLRPAAQIWTSSAQRWALTSDILSFEGQAEPFEAVLQAGRAMYGRG